MDRTLLKFLKHRDKYNLYHHGVPMEGLNVTTQAILKSYALFFKENPDAQVAMPDNFWPWMLLKYPNMKPEGKELMSIQVVNSAEDVPNDVADGIASRLAELRAALDSAKALEAYNNGEEIDLVAELRAIAERTGPGGFEIPYVPENVGDMLLDDLDDRGIKWRLDCLNRCMRPLRTGDAGIIAARVDTGKTTFIASEAAFMGPQMEGYYGARRPVIILVNEGPGKAVKQRVWQAALGATIPEMVEMQQAGVLEDKVMAALGGWESVVVLNIHDRPISYLEDLVRRLNPGMVWTDMLDNCPYDGVMTNGGTRTDQILEAMYQRQRMWAVLYDTITVATSQLNGEAEGELFPKMTHLANSKTGKPGAADYIIMSGASMEAEHARNRWISLPKNKLTKPGQRKDPQEMVEFQGDRARYANPTTL